MINIKKSFRNYITCMPDIPTLRQLKKLKRNKNTEPGNFNCIKKENC